MSFRYHPALNVLTATAEPKAIDSGLQSLSRHLPTPPTAAPTATHSGLGRTPSSTGLDTPDDGSALPDKATALRAQRGASGAGAGGGAASEAAALASLSPGRPYRWLQSLGGLGPLLTSPPQPSQIVFEVLLNVLEGR